MKSGVWQHSRPRQIKFKKTEGSINFNGTIIFLVLILFGAIIFLELFQQQASETHHNLNFITTQTTQVNQSTRDHIPIPPNGNSLQGEV